MKLISIIIPVYNEEKNIIPLYLKLSEILSNVHSRHKTEVIFVNDGSKDNTLQILQSLNGSSYNFKIINLSRNFGQQNAIKAGYDHSLGDAVICMDGDLQNPPSLIEDMISLWEKNYHVVVCKRKNGRQNSGRFKDFSSKLFYKMINSISDIKIEADTPDFRLLDRKVLTELNLFKERELFYRGLIPWLGFKNATIEYEHGRRFEGESSYSFLKMIKLALSGVTGLSTKPLYFSLLMGLLIVGVTFIAGLYAVAVHLLGNTISGWTSLIIAVVFLGGTQLFFLGIIGLYIGRIFNQVKERPYYIVDDIIN